MRPGTVVRTSPRRTTWLDGKVWFDEVPRNTRWTSYRSPNPHDRFGDGGGRQTTVEDRSRHWTGITFPTVTTDKLRLRFTNPDGVTARRAWGPSSAATPTAGAGPATTVTTAFTNHSRQPVADVRVRLRVRPGWTAIPRDTAHARRVPPGATLATRWSVRPADGVTPRDDAAPTAEAWYHVDGAPPATRARATVEIAYDAPPPRGDDHPGCAPGAFDFGELTASVVDRAGDASVRWTGTIVPRYTETYTFSMVGDNGVRLWIDGRSLIDNWAEDWHVERVGTPISLVAGHRYDIRVEYLEHDGGSNLRLRWRSGRHTRAFHPPGE